MHIYAIISHFATKTWLSLLPEFFPVTHVMTTTIALETSKGNLPLALGLGIIPLFLTFILNTAALAIRDMAKRAYG
jgi:hypothetical protein